MNGTPLGFISGVGTEPRASGMLSTLYHGAMPYRLIQFTQSTFAVTAATLWD